MSNKLTNNRLAIIIVNYKTPTLVCQLLDSINPRTIPESDRIYLVDNASNDGSIDKLQHHLDNHDYHRNVRLIASDYNGGFSYGNNLALRSAIDSGNEPEFVLLLNPDTIAKLSAIESLVSFMIKHPKVGIAGGAIENEIGHQQASAFRFHSIFSELDNALRLGIVSRLLSKWSVSLPPQSAPQQVDWVSGAFMLIRTSVIDKVGLMDEAYFLYFEEVDYCFQAHRAGWQCWHVPDSKIIHYEGQSTGLIHNDQQRRRRPQYWFQSRQRYLIKNHGLFYTLMTDIAWLLGFSIWRIRRRLQNKPDTDPVHMLRDFFKHSILCNLSRARKIRRDNDS